ncbi:hypothetical protein MKX03_016609, partial [Papaver bracteatum]
MVSTSLQNSKISDGAQQSNATAYLSSLSKTIGSYLESGGPSYPKSPRGNSSHGKPPNRDCDRTNNAGGLETTVSGGHSADGKDNESNTVG